MFQINTHNTINVSRPDTSLEWNQTGGLGPCEVGLPQRKGGFIRYDGCCRVPFGLAPPALACFVLVRLQDAWLDQACAHPTRTGEGRLIVTGLSAILSVIKDHLQGLGGKTALRPCRNSLKALKCPSVESRKHPCMLIWMFFLFVCLFYLSRLKKFHKVLWRQVSKFSADDSRRYECNAGVSQADERSFNTPTWLYASLSYWQVTQFLQSLQAELFFKQHNLIMK